MSARAPYLPIWTTSRDGLPSYVEFTSDLHQTQGPEVFLVPITNSRVAQSAMSVQPLRGTQPSLRFHQILSLGNTDSPPCFEIVLFQPARGSQRRPDLEPRGWVGFFLGWPTYRITFSCLLYLRIKKNLPRPYKVPIIIPATMVFASVYLVLVPIVAHPQPEFLYVFLFLLSGFLVYFLFVYFRYQPECLQVVTLHLQLLMEVAPTTKNAD
uniref:Uncharacterized protein n=1 Tax=Ovis aries TaxID=9940 RepID=A0AC11EA17_SHEEP